MSRKILRRCRTRAEGARCHVSGSRTSGVSGAQSQTFGVSAVQARDFFVIARMFYTQKLRPGNHQQFPKYFARSHFDFQIAVLGVNYLKNRCFSLGFLSKSKVSCEVTSTFDLLRKPKEKQQFFK